MSQSGTSKAESYAGVRQANQPPINISKSRDITERTNRSDAGDKKQTDIRPHIAAEMNSEMVECSLKTFQEHYMPFEPTEEEIAECIQLLVDKDILVKGKGKQGTLSWKVFGKKKNPDDKKDSSTPKGETAKSSAQSSGTKSKSGSKASVKPSAGSTKSNVESSAKPGGTGGDQNEGGEVNEEKEKEKKEREKEAERFGPFGEIAAAIRELQLSSREPPTLTYRDCPNTSLTSEIYGANFKMDGCFLLSDPQTKIATSTIAVAAEYKVNKGKRVENSIQLLSSANHIMNDDPRRMFCYGITIEDDEMCVWYYSHSHSCKSRYFNCITDCRTVISILMSFIFAAEEDLGFDPTVYRIVPECNDSNEENEQPKSIHYVYKLHYEGKDRFFKTILSLFAYRSLCITGRFTRVWEAIEVTDATGATEIGGKRVALKDVWLDADASTEKEIQTKIFDAVEQLGEAHRDKDIDLIKDFHSDAKQLIHDCIRKKNGRSYEDYFMTIPCDWQGKISKSTPIDAQRIPTVFSKDLGLSPEHAIDPQADRSRLSGASSARTVNGPRVGAVGSREFRSKRQYRLVYGEVGTALDDASYFKEATKAIHDTWIALIIMWLVDWVHRDISCGNILYTGNRESGNIQGKLSDLEYAKWIHSTTFSPDPKTGTPFFMATELLTGALIAAYGSNNVIDLGDASDFKPAAINVNQPEAPQIRRAPAIVYNIQHDLESLFWVAIWLLTARIDDDESQRFAKTIFINDVAGCQTRTNFFIVQGVLEDRLLALRHNQALQSFITPFEYYRSSLYSAYSARPPEAVRHRSSYIDIQKRVYTFLTFLLRLEDFDVPSSPSLIPRKKLAQKSKIRAPVNSGRNSRKRALPHDPSTSTNDPPTTLLPKRMKVTRSQGPNTQENPPVTSSHGRSTTQFEPRVTRSVTQSNIHAKARTRSQTRASRSGRLS